MGGLRWEFSRGQPSFPWELDQRQDGGAALGVMGNNGNGQPGRGEGRGGREARGGAACVLLECQPLSLSTRVGRG